MFDLICEILELEAQEVCAFERIESEYNDSDIVPVDEFIMGEV